VTVTSTPADVWRRHPQYGRSPTLELTNGEVECSRLVVVAAHPDDESLGAGGLIAIAAERGMSVYVVLLTAGEASPFASPASTRHALATLRLAEMENALARLAPENTLVFLGAPDRQVAENECHVARSLTELVGTGERTLLAAPWREDGHPDHDAAGRAAVVAARESGARLVEYPLLAWNRLVPDELPWQHARCLPLPEQLRERKEAAIRAHVSQVRAAGGQAPLPGRVLAHFTGDVEHFLVPDVR
jgi:LmbE family N-acetylglucosaminyl deacetylase